MKRRLTLPSTRREMTPCPWKRKRTQPKRRAQMMTKPSCMLLVGGLRPSSGRRLAILAVPLRHPVSRFPPRPSSSTGYELCIGSCRAGRERRCRSCWSRRLATRRRSLSILRPRRNLLLLAAPQQVQGEVVVPITSQLRARLRSFQQWLQRLASQAQ